MFFARLAPSSFTKAMNAMGGGGGGAKPKGEGYDPRLDPNVLLASTAKRGGPRMQINWPAPSPMS